MITIIKIDRKKVLLVVLVLIGVAFCAVGFGGLAQKAAGLRDNSTASTAVTLTQPENDGFGAIGDTASNQTMPSDQEKNDFETASDGSYFVEARMSLEQARGKEMETLREVLASETDESVRKTAQERLMQLSSQLSREMELENLIRAKGYQDTAVFLDNDTATVILRPDKQMAGDTNNEDIARLVAKTTGVSEDDVIVITREN